LPGALPVSDCHWHRSVPCAQLATAPRHALNHPSCGVMSQNCILKKHDDYGRIACIGAPLAQICTLCSIGGFDQTHHPHISSNLIPTAPSSQPFCLRSASHACSSKAHTWMPIRAQNQHVLRQQHALPTNRTFLEWSQRPQQHGSSMHSL